MVWLSDGGKNSKIRLAVSTEYTHVRDRRTDRQTEGHRMTAYAALVHSIAGQ